MLEMYFMLLFPITFFNWLQTIRFQLTPDILEAGLKPLKDYLAHSIPNKALGETVLSQPKV